MARRRQLTDDEKSQVRDIQKGLDGVLRCYISGEVINVNTDELEYDHIVPYSSGGPSDIQNERVFKKKYNREKGSMSLDEYKNYFLLKRLYDEKGNKVKLQDIFHFMGIQHTSINQSLNGDKLIVTDGQISVENSVYLDSKLSVNYCYLQIPTNWILNDDQQGLQPRVIDFKRLWQIKKHLENFPQLAPSIARLINNEIRLFDGQHKLAAQLLNGQKFVDVKIYLSPTNLSSEKEVYEKLLKTNLEAHSKLKQVEFYTNTLFQKWNEMWNLKWEEYLETHPNQQHSEKLFFDYLCSKESKQDATKMFEATIIKNAHDNSSLKIFTAESNKDANLPLSQDLLKKSIFKHLLFLFPTESIIDSADDFRDTESDNFEIISKLIVDKGYLKNWTSSKKNLTPEQQKARRIWTKGSVITWAPMLNTMINATFQLFDRDDQLQNLYRPKMTDDQKAKFELFFDRLFKHPFWSQNDPTIDKALGAATNVKDIFERQGLNSNYILNGR
jgi:hypothetical protein